MNCYAKSKVKKRKDNMTKLDRIIAEKSHEAVFKDTLKRTKAFDCVILLTLNRIKKHTAEWLENYYRTFIKTYDDIFENYGMGDAVITKLKDETGLDIDELYKKYVDVDSIIPKPKEDESEKLKSEIDILRSENEILKEQVEVLRKIKGV